MVKAHSFISDATILVIDNDFDNLTLMCGLLKDHCKEVEAATDVEQALKIVQSDAPPDIILLDVTMPKADGYEVCKQLKANPNTSDIPIIFLIDRDELIDQNYGFEINPVDYITKPISDAIVLARVKTHLEAKSIKAVLRDQKIFIENQVHERTAELVATQYASIYAMGYLAAARENVTGNHLFRNQNYVKILAEKLRFNPRFSSFLSGDDIIEFMYMTSPLHDIGNVGIPDRILLKPGRLTPDEFEIIKAHTQLGRNVITQAERDLGIEVPILKFASNIIYSHHEKWDGSGYPEGLAGDAIPIAARIMAIPDVYDALISRRVYKAPVPHEQAVKIILQGKGTHFDPDIVDSFYEIHEEFRCIAQNFADNVLDFEKKIDYLEQAIAINP
ncbi:MAG: HD domain-containing phosphohydrolase [Methyloglobulus sp.]